MTHRLLTQDASRVRAQRFTNHPALVLYSLFRKEPTGRYTRVSDSSYVDFGIASAVYMNRIIESGLNFRVRRVS